MCLLKGNVSVKSGALKKQILRKRTNISVAGTERIGLYNRVRYKFNVVENTYCINHIVEKFSSHKI